MLNLTPRRVGKPTPFLPPGGEDKCTRRGYSGCRRGEDETGREFPGQEKMENPETVRGGKRGDFIPEDSPERKKISVENLC
ncbi:hypothetical protein MASR2M79_03340 [Aminivibrio sp.]